MAIFNSKEYSWSNVEISMLGRVLTRARGVMYNTEKEKEHLYGRGENPIAIQSGNKAYTGELRVLQSELERLELELARDEDITDLGAINIIVAYVPKNGGAVITHTLKGCEFTAAPREMNQNDKFQEIALPFLFLGRQ